MFPVFQIAPRSKRRDFFVFQSVCGFAGSVIWLTLIEQAAKISGLDSPIAQSVERRTVNP